MMVLLCFDMASVLSLLVFASGVGVVFGEAYTFPDATTFWVNSTQYLMYFSGTRQWLAGTSEPQSSEVDFEDPKRAGESVAVHYAWNQKVISERGTKTIAVYQSTTALAVYAHVGTSPLVGHVTVDWLSNNVYWTDPGFGWIGLQALTENLTNFQTNGRLKVVVSSSLDRPYGITVLPQIKRLFWSDHGENPKLESSDLLGHNRRALVWQGLAKPTALCADHTTQRLYWVDEVKATVESCDQEGQGRRIIVSLPKSSQLGGLQVFENDVIVSDRNRGELQAYDKETGHAAATPFSGAINAGDLAVFSAALQPRDSATCNSSSCDHICVHEGGCVCASGYALDNDGTTCTEQATSLWKSFLVSTENRICAVPVNLLFSHPYLPPVQIDSSVLCFVDNGGSAGGGGSEIQFLAVDSLNATLYYNSGRRFRRFYIHTGVDDVVYFASGNISGMAYDWLSGVLVWTQQSPSDVVFGLSLTQSGATSVTLYGDVSRPSHITVDSYRGYMFWIEDETEATPAQIWSGTVNGSQTKVSILNTGLTRPRHLTYDHQTDKLYWLDLDHVGVIDPDGTNKHIDNLNSVNTIYRGLAVFRSYVVWSTTDTGLSQLTFRSVELAEVDDLTTFSVSSKIDGVTDIVFYDASLSLDSGMVFCELDNGGCSQLCIVDGNSYRCRCHFGFQLHQDGVTCIANHVSSDFFLVTDALSNRLYQITADGQTVTAIPLQNGARPELVVFNWVSGDIIWYDSEAAAIKSSALDGSSVRVVRSLKEAGRTTFNSVGALCLDHSTGNLFFTEISASNSVGWIRVISLRSLVMRTLYQPANSPPRFLAIAPSQGRLVFGTDAGTIYLTDMSMDKPLSVLGSDIAKLSGLVFSDDGTTVQWTDEEADSLWRVPLSTRKPERRLHRSRSFPRAAFAWGSLLYYLTSSGRSINALSSSDVETTVVHFPEFGYLSSLHFFGPQAPQEVTSCGERNGRCSSLCLPTSPTQRQCQCGDGVDLLPDKRTCSDVELCPSQINNGQFSSTCDRYPAESCSYTCEEGYAANPSALSIRCGTSGQWEVATDGLCLRTCPRSVPHGQMGAECPLVAGTTCGVTCDAGFAPSKDTVDCRQDGTWSVSPERLCQESNIGETLPVYAIAIISAGGVAILAVVLGCCLYRRMKKYGGRDSSIRRLKGLNPSSLSPGPNPPTIWVTDSGGVTGAEGGAAKKGKEEEEEGEVYAELESVEGEEGEAGPRYSSFSKISPAPGRKPMGRPRSPLLNGGAVNVGYKADGDYVEPMAPILRDDHWYGRSLSSQLLPQPTPHRGFHSASAEGHGYLTPVSVGQMRGGTGDRDPPSRPDQRLQAPEPHRFHPASHALGDQEPAPDYLQVIPPSPRAQHGAKESLPFP